MDALTLAVFALTYLGMAAGRLPGLAVDRAWIAVAAATTLIVARSLHEPDALEQALSLIDSGTLVLLFSLMVISIQVEFAGWYQRLANRIAALADRPALLLALVTASAGASSAVLVNDIVAFALAPVLLRALPPRGLDPAPFLIALAMACNAGSAASLIGNPQNVLIGQAGRLDFWEYAALAAVPAMAAMACVHGVIWLQWHRRWRIAQQPAPVVGEILAPAGSALRPALAIAALLTLFLTDLPREAAALAIAVLLCADRRRPSRDLVQTIDWNLLLLFAGLFVVTGSAARTAELQTVFGRLPQWVVHSTAGIATLSLVAGNLIGNVPLAMLHLNAWPEAGEPSLQSLALLSTLAGNALLTGSVVNLIVVESARQHGWTIGFRAYARCGLPVALASMAFALGWLAAPAAAP